MCLVLESCARLRLCPTFLSWKFDSPASSQKNLKILISLFLLSFIPAEIRAMNFLLAADVWSLGSLIESVSPFFHCNRVYVICSSCPTISCPCPCPCPRTTGTLDRPHGSLGRTLCSWAWHQSVCNIQH